MDRLPTHLQIEIVKPIVADWMLNDTLYLNTDKVAMMLQTIDNKELKCSLNDVIRVAFARKQLRAAARGLCTVDMMALDRLFHTWELANIRDYSLRFHSGVKINFQYHTMVFTVDVGTGDGHRDYNGIIDDVTGALAYVSIHCPWMFEMCRDANAISLVPVRSVSETRGDGLIKTRTLKTLTWDEARKVQDHWVLLEAAFASVCEWADLTSMDNIAKMRATFSQTVGHVNNL